MGLKREERGDGPRDLGEARRELASLRRELADARRAALENERELAAARRRLDEQARDLDLAVRTTGERYRRLMESASDAIVILDGAGRVLEMNRRAEDLLGRPRVEVAGRRFVELLRPEEAAVAERGFERLLAEGQVRAPGVHFRRPDGRRLVVDVSASVALVDGRRSALVIVVDVTERSRLEREVLQVRKMDAIGRLAGGVAHGFNNLLTAIAGYSDLLLAQLGDRPSLLKFIEEIKRAGDRAAALTRQLLAFSRKQVLAPRLVDLNELVSNLAEMLRWLIGEDIELALDLDPSIGRVRIDPGQMDQVVLNLVVNARDAMPEGGKLTISTSEGPLDEPVAGGRDAGLAAGPYVRLTVADTGQGMDDRVLAHLFEPFFTTKEEGKGTGLGLSTIYGVVTQSGGLIDASSEPGRGSTFRVYLPRVGAAVEPAGAAEPAAAGEGSETVLVVEDEEVVRALVREILQAARYSVLEAANGAEALALCEKHPGPIHLLVTDLVMPGMSGRELARFLVPLRRGMKVLYMSGYSVDTLFEGGVPEAGSAFLQKPFTPTTLARQVRELLDAPPRALGTAAARPRQPRTKGKQQGHPD